MLLPASYANGFAPRDGSPLYSELWRGCVGAWNPGLGVSGLTLRDWSGLGNNGTLTGGPNWTPTAGRQSIDCDGVNDYIRTSNVTSNIFSSAVTYSISMWLNADSVANSPVVLSTVNYSVTNEIFLELGASRIYWGNSNGSNQARTYTTASYVGRWIHLAAVKTGTGDSGKLYLDGVEQTSYTGVLTSPSTLAFGNLVFGTYGFDLSLWLDGKIGEVLIARPAWTSQTVRLLATRRGIAYEMAPRRRSSSAVTTNRRRRIIIGGNR